MSEVRTVGANGQISLGKKYAGRTVLLEQTGEGVWKVRLAQVIPDNELWLHKEPAKSILDEALAWAEANPEPRVSDLREFEDRFAPAPKPLKAKAATRRR